MLRENFNRSYQTNRAPFVLTLNTDFLNVLPDNGALKALDQFLTSVRVIYVYFEILPSLLQIYFEYVG